MTAKYTYIHAYLEGDDKRDEEISIVDDCRRLWSVSSVHSGSLFRRDSINLSREGLSPFASNWLWPV